MGKRNTKKLRKGEDKVYDTFIVQRFETMRLRSIADVELMEFEIAYWKGECDEMDHEAKDERFITLKKVRHEHHEETVRLGRLAHERAKAVLAQRREPKE